MNLIYVDDEFPARENFRVTVAPLAEVTHLELLEDGDSALEYAMHHQVDVAFLDMEMSGLHGLTLAARLKELRKNIQVVFVTAYSQYAMDAWNVDAIGYILKPFGSEDICKVLRKAKSYHPRPTETIVIQTIPSLSVSIGGKPFHFSGKKVQEMFALLVDHGDQGITTGDGISYLWPERPNDANSQSLFRMTYKRLVEALDAVGVGHIVASADKRRFLVTDQVECDLYRIFSGDEQAAKLFSGQYLREYSWAEERCAQLCRMLLEQ